LPREVTKMNSRMPAARASSMAYWIRGRSTSGRISFGTDLVAGRNRVPNPATGRTALVTLIVMLPLSIRLSCATPVVPAAFQSDDVSLYRRILAKDNYP
jgi:hypothetical protein